jgi:hypothetical protein
MPTTHIEHPVVKGEPTQVAKLVNQRPLVAKYRDTNNMVTADQLITEWDDFLASFNNLWEIEMEVIQMITWSTDGGGRSPPGTTKIKRPKAIFQHAIQQLGTKIKVPKKESKEDSKHNKNSNKNWSHKPDKTTPNILDKARGDARNDARGDTMLDARHEVGDKSNDENRVFDPGGNPRLTELANITTTQQPTRPKNMKQFVILQWSEEDLISFTDCPFALHAADSVTKQTGRTRSSTNTLMLSWDDDDRIFRRRPRQALQSMLFSASQYLRQLL